MSMSREFNHQVAWVVGASGDIGAAVCKVLASRGAQVIASSRKANNDLALKLSVSGAPAVRALAVDVTSRQSVDDAASWIAKEFSRIDMLVNTTSVSIFGDFLKMDDADWLNVYQSKVFGYMRTMRAIIPYMLSHGGGRIVNMSGRGGHQPTLPVHLAGMSGNAAVNLIGKSLANMYGNKGIRINTIAPGPVKSSRYQKVMTGTQNLSSSASHAGASTFNTAPVSGALIDVDEIANITAFLLSSESACITGTVIQADGGSTASL